MKGGFRGATKGEGAGFLEALQRRRGPFFRGKICRVVNMDCFSLFQFQLFIWSSHSYKK